MQVANPGGRAGHAGVLHDPAARSLHAGELDAAFLPSRGMLGASLRHHGLELLGRVDDLETAAAKGSTAGIPLLYPWANRLAAHSYAAAGRAVSLDPSSPLLHSDEHGLPMHGVPWSALAWKLVESGDDAIVARLEWDRGDLLEIFPFRHALEMRVTLLPEGLIVDTTLVAGPDSRVPVSFGFHPYFTLPGVDRAQWRLELPVMSRLALDPRGIPTGAEELFAGFGARLGDITFDHGFVLPDERQSFSLAGGGRRITVELLEGYRYAQVFAPAGKPYVALEPMTAPTNALASGNGLRLVEPNGRFHARFWIRVDEVPS